MALTTKRRKPQGWHAADIRAAVTKRGKTLSGLALDAGLDPSACRAALIRPLPKAERVISRFLDVPLHELWPERWDSEGRRFRHVRDGNYHERDLSQRQNVKAA
jgi:Ner family transcriptional regulator